MARVENVCWRHRTAKRCGSCWSHLAPVVSHPKSKNSARDSSEKATGQSVAFIARFYSKITDVLNIRFGDHIFHCQGILCAREWPENRYCIYISVAVLILLTEERLYFVYLSIQVKYKIQFFIVILKYCTLNKKNNNVTWHKRKCW